MADSTITCPNCKSDIPLGEAVAHRLREELAADFEKERQRLTQAISEREAKIASERKAIEERSRAVADEISRGLDVERAKLRDAALREAAEQSALAMKDLQAQLESQQKRLAEAQGAELELRIKQRELAEAKDAMELNMARKLDEERQRISEEARVKAAEAE